MGYWGWRPLALWGFISVLVIGCSTTTPIAPPSTPTEYPPVTLTVRRSASATPSFGAASVPTATATPVTPTSTPTATPTPVVYIVREGDTLLGIAISFGVDVADLQAANEGIDPRGLQIGQQLIIPPPRPIVPDETASSVLPTPTPLALAVPPPACYATQGGGVTCLGEISNSLNVPLERLAVSVQLLNADGTTGEQMVSAIEQRMLPVGGTAPYRAQFPMNPGRGSYDVGVVLLSADEAKNIDLRFVSLQVSDESADNQGERYVVSALVRNADSVNALAVRATLTVHSSSGNVLGYRVVQVLDTLPPGEDVPVRVEVMPQNEDRSATHTLYVEAQRGE